MSLSGDWRRAKGELEAAKVDTRVFRQGLRSLLADFEAAEDKVDDARGIHSWDGPKMRSLRADLRSACNRLGPVAAEYEEVLRHLAQRAVDQEQRKATTSAASFLFGVLNQVKVARKLT